MNTQMIVLKNLTLDTLDPKMESVFTAAQLESWALELPLVIDKLFHAMRAEVYGSVNDNLVKRHIQQTQNDCVFLLHALQEQPLPVSPLSPLQQNLAKGLERVLAYIERYHGQYFSQQVKVPHSLFKVSMAELEPQMKVLLMGLKKKEVDPPLRDLVMKNFSDFQASGLSTYERMLYMRNLQDSLIRLCREAPVPDFNQLLIDALIYMLYNEPAFEAYIKGRMLDTLAKLYSLSEKYEQLYLKEKSIKVLQERTTGCYDPQRPNLKLVLLTFVKAELKYLGKKQRVAMGTGAVAYTHSNKLQLQGPEYRMMVTLSVDSLAYLIRLLIEAGVIVANPRSELLQFLARHVQTPGIGHAYLSAKSLSTKYKQVVQSTANSVHALLSRMLKLLNKEFNIGN
jgi:hypothetical protein